MKRLESYNQAIDSVAREKRYLARLEGPSLEHSRNFMNHFISHHYPQYLAIKEEQVVGWCDVAPFGMTGFSHVGGLGMGVIESCRSQGIGRRLMELTLKHAKELSRLEKIQLEVFKGNRKGVAFYKKQGFQQEGCKIRARKLEGIYDDLLVMGKFL